MKKLTITIADVINTVKSEAAMWKFLRKLRDRMDPKLIKPTDPHAMVTIEDGTLFKEIVFKVNSKDKIEMVNLVKATCRRQMEKARKAAKEKAEKEAARKARKAEANRRYRARKKAAAEALKAEAVETTAAEVTAPQEA